MRSETKTPSIGRVPPHIDDEARRMLQSIKEILEVREGQRGSDYLDKAVTYRDLVSLGLITESQVPKK